MKSTSKLSCEERRAAIVTAVRRVFAEKGFHGTTTRALAEAAGVSEALLFKHFPNKEALYAAMQVACITVDPGRRERLKALEPSTAALVFLVHLIVTGIVGRAAEDDQVLHDRLLLRSLTEDGEFARLFLQGMPAQGNRKLTECLKAAVAAGDAADGPVLPNLGAWFAHHVAVLVKLYLLPARPVLDYGVARDRLVEQVVWFALRGMGLKEEAIKRHYNAKALARFEI